jgi:hypothetical protein
MKAEPRAPGEIILDLDAADDPLHGHQEGRFFHGYYDGVCYLPLYILGGRHLLAAKLRPAIIDAAAGALEEVIRITKQIRRRWLRTRMPLRADSGFCRNDLMAWCENNRVDYGFGLARNARLVDTIGKERQQAEKKSLSSGRPSAPRPQARAGPRSPPPHPADPTRWPSASASSRPDCRRRERRPTEPGRLVQPDRPDAQDTPNQRRRRPSALSLLSPLCW